MAGDSNDNVAKDIRRTGEPNAAPDPSQKQKSEADHLTLIARGVPRDDISNKKLYVELILEGQETEIEWRGSRIRLPDWPDGLYTDRAAAAFLYTGKPLDRDHYETLQNQFIHWPDDAQRLLRDLVHDGCLDLALPEMKGTVAKAWALGEPYRSGVRRVTWLSMFRHNGYASIGDSLDRPTTSLHLYRGATDEHKRGMAWTCNLEVARDFAFNRISSRPVGHVYAAKIEPDWLLAYINEDNSEEEWVIDPSNLQNSAVKVFESEAPGC